MSGKIVGRPRKYETPAAFQNAVNRYFASISRVVLLTEEQDTGEKDENGHKIIEKVPVMNQAGKQAEILEYLQKPSLTGLCMALGIVKDTWYEYASREAYADICKMTMNAIEQYYEERLGSGKGDMGVKFVLEHNFGWKNRVEVEAGPETRKTMEATPKTMEDKLALLQSLGLQVPGDEHDET